MLGRARIYARHPVSEVAVSKGTAETSVWDHGSRKYILWTFVAVLVPWSGVFTARIFTFVFLLWPLWVLLGFFYYWVCVSRPQLYYMSGNNAMKRILGQCPSLFKLYKPTLYCFNGHLQTAVPDRLRSGPIDLPLERHYLPTKDEGQIALDFIKDDIFDEFTPIVLILTGVSGSIESPYIRNLMESLWKKGYHSVTMNYRGTGSSILLNRSFTNISQSTDVLETVNYLHTKYPKASLFAVGFSAGANLLTKYLGEEGEKSALSGAVCISGPYDLHLATKKIEGWLVRWTYNYIMTNSMKAFVRKHLAVFKADKRINFDRLFKARTMREFDNEFTVKVGNFKDLYDYYTKATVRPYIHKIRVPTLFVSAINDPIIDANAIPYQQVTFSPATALCVTRTGGHIGWSEGIWPRRGGWAERVAEEFFTSVLKERHQAHTILT